MRSRATLNQRLRDTPDTPVPVLIAGGGINGIRPLPWSGEGATGAISRDHALRPFEVEQSRPFPVLTLVGGKWTTYRACAEQIADAVLLRLGKVLNHGTELRRTITSRVYIQHDFMTEKKAALDAWAMEIEKITQTNSIAGNVVALRAN